MKKILSIMLAAIMVLSISAVSFATMEVDTGSGKTTVEATVNKADGKEIHNLVNQARKAAGVAEIAWSDELYEVAVIRAHELAVLWSHTRPNGKMPESLNSKINGENVQKGAYTPQEAFDDLMNSPGHKANILTPDYKSGAHAFIELADGSDSYTAQLFSLKEASGGTETPDPEKPDPEKPTIPTKPSTPNTSTSSGGGSSSGGSSKADTSVFPSSTSKSSGTGTVATTAQSISGSTQLKLSDGTAKKADVLTAGEIKNYSEKKLTINADTLVSGKVDARLYISPSSLSARTTDYKLGVHTSSKNITAIQSLFAKSFKNKLVAVEIEESDLTVSTHIAVKVDLTDFNTDSLSFYTYDATNNKYYPLANTKYSIDNNGYLHFYTGIGGYVLISDGNLSK